MGENRFDRLQAVFLQAAEISDPSAREAWLGEACGADTELRRRVEALLAADQAPHPLLQLPAAGDDVDETQLMPEASAGTVIAGRYKLLEQIGEGGMGLVWMAEQRTPVRRLVAVKLIKAGMDTRAVLARFEAERQALAMMDHPSIARVFDGGVTDRGHPWFAMELVRGLPVTQYCDERRLRVADRLQLLMQVCSAVQHAHQKGIIHRDLKPSNVLVTEHDGRPLPKIIDFGLAKALGGGPTLTERTLYTSFGMAAGTPLYMAPEQVAINALDIDTRADVYALGVLLYELLTGTTPLDRQRVKAAAWDEVRRVIREEEPPRPSVRLSSSAALPSLAATRDTEPTKLVGLVRGDLDWIVLKALEKDRNRRYESASALSADVARHLASEPVLAAPPSLIYRAKKVWRKHRGPLVAALLLLGVLVASTIVISGLALRLNEQVQLATAALNEAEAASDREARQRIAAEEAREKAVTQSYLNGIAATQNAIRSNNWPEARQRLEACPLEKRGWEWAYLRAVTAAPMYGLPNLASSCELSRDGRFLLAQSGNDFELFDTDTRKTLATFKAKAIRDTYYYGRGALAADGYVAIQRGRSIELYSPTGREATIDVRDIGGETFSLKFSPQGTYLLVIVGGDCHVFRVADGARIGKITSPQSPAPFVFAPNEQSIGTFTGRSAVTLFSVTGTKRREIQHSVDAGSPSAICFSPDSRMVVVGTDRGNVLRFEVERGELTSRFAAGPDGVRHASFSPDAEYLLVDTYAEQPSTVAVWHVGSDRRLVEVRKACNAPRFSSDGEKIVGFDDGGIWRWRDGAGPTAFFHPAGNADVRAFSDDVTIAASVDEGRVRIWDTSQRSLHPANQYVEPPELPSEEMWFRIGGLICPLKNWNSAIAEAALVLAESRERLDFTRTTAAAADGSWQARCLGDGTCAITSPDGKRMAVLTSHGGPVRAMARTGDGHRLITGGNDGTIRFWDTETWTEVATFRHGSPITGLALSQDGTRLVITFSDQIEVWDTRDMAARQQADVALAAEHGAAAGMAESRLAGNEEGPAIVDGVFEDRSYSAVRRVAILAELSRQADDTSAGLRRMFRKLKAELRFKQAVEEELRGQQFANVQRAEIDRLLAEWEQTPEEVRNACIEIAESVESPRPLVERARAIMQQACEREPGRIGLRMTLASLEYRLGNYEHAAELMRERNSWVDDENRVNRWEVHSENMAYLAMAEHQLGHDAEARRCLRLALRYWYGMEPFTKIQIEAAQLISPAAIDLTPPPASSEWQAVDAIDAADTKRLESLLGEEVRIKGRVVRVVPTIAGRAANVVLDPSDRGVLLWMPFEQDLDFHWEFAKSLDGQEIVVAGTIGTAPKSANISPWAQGRLQVQVTSREQVQIIGDPTSVRHWWAEDDVGSEGDHTQPQKRPTTP